LGGATNSKSQSESIRESMSADGLNAAQATLPV